MQNLSVDNVVWGIDPKPSQMDFLTNLLSDEGFVRELKTLLWWVKPNLKFYQGKKWAKLLALILEKFYDKYRILDAKCSDWINTEKWVIDEYRSRVDAITIAPASGDDLSYIEYLQNPTSLEKKVDVICMWAMSFPGTISDLINWNYDIQKAKVTRSLEAWVAWVVMWATAYNTDVVKELEKLKTKIKEWSIEHACLRWYSDRELVEWILLRNKLFEELMPLIAKNSNARILTPGFWRQWWSSDFFIPEFNHRNKTRFNFWSDSIKGLENESISNARTELLKRAEAFWVNLSNLSTSPWERKFITPAEYEFERLLHTWTREELFTYIWSIYERSEWWPYCQLASGLYSTKYINVWAEPERSYKILRRSARELSEKLKEKWINADITMWAQMWSVKISGVLAEEMWVNTSIYAEKKSGTNILYLKRHDIDLTWKRVILSEDVITQWSTLEQMIRIVEEKWWEVVGVTCTCNRHGKDNFTYTRSDSSVINIPLIYCFIPPSLGELYWDENTFDVVRSKMEGQWKTEEEIQAKINEIKETHKRLPEWVKIERDPKGNWSALTATM